MKEHDFIKPLVNVGRISYMNVAPVYYGFDNGQSPSWLNMVSKPPSLLNEMLADKTLDISPVSSVAYARHQDEWLLLPDLSIACAGPVMSVILVSNHPFEQLAGKKVILTRESATGAALLRLLFALKQICPISETGKICHPESLQKNTDAALIIGDAALREKWHRSFAHVWDLGEMWWHLTGLPFVFALWAVRKSFAEKKPELVASVMEQFYLSRHEGLRNKAAIIPVASEKLRLPASLCGEYYDKLRYDLDSAKIKGLEAFFEGLYLQKIIANPVQLSFFSEHAESYTEIHAA